jgi:tRNA-dihydrouridine synthase 3
MDSQVPNLLDPDQSLKRSYEEEQAKEAHPPQPILPEDSAVTKAEKAETNGANGLCHVSSAPDSEEEPAQKKIKLDVPESETPKTDAREKVKGIALVKPE